MYLLSNMAILGIYVRFLGGYQHVPFSCSFFFCVRFYTDTFPPPRDESTPKSKTTSDFRQGWRAKSSNPGTSTSNSSQGNPRSNGENLRKLGSKDKSGLKGPGKKHEIKTPSTGGLDGGFQYFSFSPLFGEDFQFDDYVSKGLTPPTSGCLLFFVLLISEKIAKYHISSRRSWWLGWYQWSICWTCVPWNTKQQRCHKGGRHMATPYSIDFTMVLNGYT